VVYYGRGPMCHIWQKWCISNMMWLTCVKKESQQHGYYLHAIRIKNIQIMQWKTNYTMKYKLWS